MVDMWYLVPKLKKNQEEWNDEKEKREGEKKDGEREGVGEMHVCVCSFPYSLSWHVHMEIREQFLVTWILSFHNVVSREETQIIRS